VFLWGHSLRHGSLDIPGAQCLGARRLEGVELRGRHRYPSLCEDPALSLLCEASKIVENIFLLSWFFGNQISHADKLRTTIINEQISLVVVIDPTTPLTHAPQRSAVNFRAKPCTSSIFPRRTTLTRDTHPSNVRALSRRNRPLSSRDETL
jgi:hypothetical protein